MQRYSTYRNGHVDAELGRRMWPGFGETHAVAADQAAVKQKPAGYPRPKIFRGSPSSRIHALHQIAVK